MKRLRVAQIGTSETTHAVQTFRAMVNQPDLFEVVAYADVDRHTHDVFDDFKPFPCMTPDELLEIPGLDAVAIECDEVLLTKYALMAAEKGLAIHMDKPGSEPQDEYDRLIDIIEEKNLVFQTGYMYRYNPAVEYAMQAVKDGKLGHVYAVETHMDCWHKPAMRRWFKTFRGGMMFYLGCHLTDLIVNFMGLPDEVLAMNSPCTAEIPDANDYGMAILKYPTGVSFAKACAVEAGGFLRRQLVICGDKGRIEIRPLERSVGLDILECDMRECYADENGESSWNDDGVITTFGPFHRYEPMMADFAAMVRGEKTNPWTPEYERKLHEVVRKTCGF